MIISGEYFAIGDGRGGISLTVQRVSPPGKVVQGSVVNGAWRGTFIATGVAVDPTGGTFLAPVIWQGDELIVERDHFGGWATNDYGFAYVEKEITAGRTGLEAAV